MNRYATFAAALLLAALPAQASEESSETHETVIVTASRTETTAEETAAAVTIITREDIEQSNARNLADLLRRVPGLFVAQSGGAGHLTSAFMRGSDAKHTLVLLDGVPLNDPAFGLYDLAHLPLDRVERVEIVRGAGSAVHGSNAGGGVINVITRRPASEGGEMRGAASLAAGTNSTHAALASIEAEFGGAALSLSASSDAADNDFPNDGYRRHALTARLDADLAHHTKMTLSAHRLGAEIEIGPQYGFDPLTFTPTEKLDENAEQTERQALFAARFVTEPERGRGWMQTAEISYRRRANRYDDPTDAAWPESLFSRDDASEIRLVVAEHFRRETSHGVLGAEWRRTDGRSDADYASPFWSNAGAYDARTTTAALFAERRWSADGLVVELAGRYETHRTRAATAYEDPFTPASSAHERGSVEAMTYRAALAQTFPNLGAGGKFRFVVASSFRHPALVDIFFPGGFGNPDLRPEHGQSVEAGWDQRFFDGKTALSLTLFRNRYRDLIEFSFATFTVENIGRAAMEGAEFSWEQEISRGFRATLAYTYLDARNLSTGAALLRRPRHAGSARLSYVHDRFDAHIEAFRAGTRPDNPFGGAYPDRLHPYTLVSAFGSVKVWKGVSATFRATNLLDENYEATGAYPSASRGKITAAAATGFPLLRRAWMLGVKAEWGKK